MIAELDVINIAANKQEQWEAVADVLGVPELKTDPRFRERDTRKKNRRELTPLLESRLVHHETAYWVEELNKHDVPRRGDPEPRCSP